MDTENKFASCVGWVVAWVGAIVVSTLVDGWALSTVWNWFMPRIFNLISLTFMQSIGVAMVFSLFTRTNKIDKRSSEGKKSSLELWLETLLVPTFTAIFTVGLAWIILQFAF